MPPALAHTLVHDIVPRLRSALTHSVRRVGAEDAEELLQDATLLAARLLLRCAERGQSVTPGNIAYYTLLHLRAGRRSHYSGRSDVLGSRTQLSGYSRVHPLDEPLATESEVPGKPLTLAEVLAGDAEDPAATAARNLDWQAFLATLDDRARAVLRCLAGELRWQAVAHRYGVGRSTVQAWRKCLTELLRTFMGAEVLAELQRGPGWQAQLRALREQLACRLERNHPTLCT
jgi:hypothetical protein